MKLTENIDFVRKNTVIKSEKAYIDSSSIHGFGLFASEPIPENEKIMHLQGQIMTPRCYQQIKEQLSFHTPPSMHDYFFMECNSIDDETMLVRPYRTFYSYLNHSDQPNAYIRIEKQSGISIISKKEIKENEEILINYREESIPREALSKESMNLIDSQ